MMKLLLFPPTVTPNIRLTETPRKSRGGNPRPNHVLANEAKVTAARSRYKSVMGNEWVPTNVIESRLGTGRGCVNETLRKFVARGEMVRRPVKDGQIKRKGYEWKWVEK